MGAHRRRTDTGGCKFVKIFATPGWRITSVCYSHQYEQRRPVAADLDEDDDLEAIDLDLAVEAGLGDDAEDIVELGEEICHVHSALVEELHADISVESGV